MADYSKQTVAALRAVLKERGIPSTGLTRKQQIIDKLEAADKASRADEATPDEAQTEEHVTQTETHYTEVKDADESAPVQPAEVPAPIVDAPIDSPKVASHPASATPEQQATKDLQGQAAEDVQPPTEPEQPAFAASEQREKGATVEEKTVSSATSERTIEPAPPVAMGTETVPKSSPAVSERTLADETQRTAPMTQESSVDVEEVIEDTRKRKRRSASPPVHEEEVARKKPKQEEVVRLPEDMEKEGERETKEQDEPDTTGQQDVPMADAQPTEPSAEVAMDTEVEAEAPIAKEQLTPEKTGLPDVQMAGAEATEPKETSHEPPSAADPAPNGVELVTASKPPPTSPQSAKPKFPSLSNLSQSAQPTPVVSPPIDRDVPPALHPATCSLYIRNLMRPLQPALLRNYLIAIAASPSSATPTNNDAGEPTQKSATTDDTSNPLPTFHLSPIRDHALATFAAPAAAARARTALHGAVWPAERDRRPLWADFVPDEQLAGWIAAETSTSPAAGAPRGGGSGIRKWEVVYEDADDGGGGGGVVAVHREVGSGATSAGLARGLGVPDAPTRPAADRRPVPEARADTSRPFRALEELFRSTAAKPKLYFLPVADDVVRERRRELERSDTGAVAEVGGRGTGKYSFEGTRLVEIEERGAVGGGGGGYGGGGGWRGGRRRSPPPPRRGGRGGYPRR